MNRLNQKSRVIAGLFAGLLFAISVSNPAMAETTPAESITLSPVNKRYNLDAGTVTNDEFTIVNDGKTDYDFIVYARPYFVTDGEYDPDYTSEKSNADAYKWIQFSQAKYRLAAGQSTKVSYSVNVPASAKPGGHYGVLFAETQHDDSAGGNSVVRNKRVGAVVYATVKGEYITGGDINEVKTDFFQTKKPLKSSVNVSNSGNSDFMANVRFVVKDAFGNPKYVEEKDYVILPETQRDISLEWRGSPWFGLYKVDVTTKLLDKEENSSKYVLLAPEWTYALVILTVVGGIFYASVRHRR